MKKILLGVLVIVILLSTSVHAEQYISGVISESATWTQAEGPYIITGETEIGEGVTVTIESGTVIKFNETAGHRTHRTHFDIKKGPGLPHTGSCVVCHESSMLKSDACDVCHGNGTGYALDHWHEGVYEADEKTLRPESSEWCVGCHDGYGVNSKYDESGAIAPNIKGDGMYNGYYVTGHNIACSNCHDFERKHIDHAQRSYSRYGSVSYKAGYRLKEINGGDPLEVPRLEASDPQQNTQSFALCFSCHNQYEILGTRAGRGLWHKDPSETNFFDSEDSKNHHYIHLGFDSDHWDSDWDGEKDSRENCTTCHNVHGSPTGPMLRHGELISTPGTTDKVPALDFCYQVPTNAIAGAEFRPTLAADGPGTQAEYEVSAWWTNHPNRATNAHYTIVHSGAEPTIIDTIDQSEEGSGGKWQPLGTYYFNEGDGGYIIVSNENVNGFVVADAFLFSRVGGGEDVTVDNSQAVYDSTWIEETDMPGQQYNGSYLYHDKQKDCDSAGDVTESMGACINFKGLVPLNGVCKACHDEICYPRDPYLGPRFLDKDATSSFTVSLLGDTVTFSEWIISYSDVTDVTIDLSPVGGSSNQPLYDDGSNGDVSAGDNIYTYQATLDAEDLKDTNLFLTLKVTTSAGVQREILIFLNVMDPDAIYIDNYDAVYNSTETWLVATDMPEQYLLSYQYNEGGTGDDWARFIPDIPLGEAGYYNIYTWWTANFNRADNAPYTIIYHDEYGAQYNETLYVNQQQHGGRWVYFGNFYLEEGTDNYVELGDNANGYVIADAAKFKKGPPPLRPYPIVDNLDILPIGPWPIGTDLPLQQYEGTYQYQAGGTGSCKMVFRPQVPADKVGNHNIFARWTQAPNRASNAPYTIVYHDELGAQHDKTVYVNQKQNGGDWIYLGNFYLEEGTDNYVELSDNANGYVIADAVKFEYGDPPVGPYEYIDNLEVTPVGPWTIATDMPTQQYLDSYQFQSRGTGSYTMTFRPTVPVANAGPHNIYARWTDNPNRASNAPYTIRYYDTDAADYVYEIIYVNQKYNGGDWMYLGNFYLAAGTENYVELSDNANGYVIADAIHFEYGAPPDPIVDNLNAAFSHSTWVLRDDMPGEQYMDTYHYHAPGNGSRTATFTAHISTPGTYKVYVRWTDHENRATDAPYTVYDKNGATTFYVDQSNIPDLGGQWIELEKEGGFNFEVGSYDVVLTACPSGYVIADAVKWEFHQP